MYLQFNCKYITSYPHLTMASSNLSDVMNWKAVCILTCILGRGIRVRYKVVSKKEKGLGELTWYRHHVTGGVVAPELTGQTPHPRH